MPLHRLHPKPSMDRHRQLRFLIERAPLSTTGRKAKSLIAAEPDPINGLVSSKVLVLIA